MTLGGKEVSITNMNVPFVSAVLAAIWLVGTTLTLTIQWYAVKEQITQLTALAITSQDKLNDRIIQIERELAIRTRDRWTRDNHVLWCAKTEQINNGWKCADPPPIAPGSMQYWRQGWIEGDDKTKIDDSKQ